MTRTETRSATQHQTEELVFAIAAVDGSTRVGRTRPDLEMAAVLSEYYALAAESLSSSQGRIIKVIGDGILVVFPVSRAREAVAALRRFQSSATALWSEIDPSCRAQVKVGVGTLATGPFGPPGASGLMFMALRLTSSSRRRRLSSSSRRSSLRYLRSLIGQPPNKRLKLAARVH